MSAHWDLIHVWRMLTAQTLREAIPVCALVDILVMASAVVQVS